MKHVGFFFCFKYIQIYILIYVAFSLNLWILSSAHAIRYGCFIKLDNQIASIHHIKKN